MNLDDIKEYILKNPYLREYFDLDGSGSIERDELEWFISKAEGIIKEFENPDRNFLLRKGNNKIGTFKFRDIPPDLFNKDIFISVRSDSGWFPLLLLDRIHREGIEDEDRSENECLNPLKEEWFHKNRLLLINSSQQRLYYSGIIKDADRDAVIARVKTDPNYVNSFLFLSIVPNQDYSSRKKYRKIMTARILVDDNQDRPCIEIKVDPGILKFFCYNVYDRRNTYLQSVYLGSIKKSIMHFLYKGRIGYDKKNIIVSGKGNSYIFNRGSRAVAKISRIKIPISEAIIENKRCYGLEFIDTDLSDGERMLIISYLLTTDSKFWIHYRY